MILGSLDYKGHAILDFSPRYVIGSQSNHITFDSLDHAKQWLDEFYKPFDPDVLTNTYIKEIALDIMRENLSDIARDKDYWYGIKGFDFNYHDIEDQGFLNIDIYPLDDPKNYFSI